MSVNSHVQMPASIMRGFSIHKQTHETLSLDVTNSSLPITPEVIKKHGTRWGYFDDKAEKTLKETEESFGLVKKSIVQSIKSGKDVEFTSENLITIKRFITFTISRLVQITPMVQHNSWACRITGESISPSHTIRTTGLLYPSGELVNYLYISIIVNKSTTSFIAPENCFYGTDLEKLDSGYPHCECLCFPITPQIAILLCEKDLGTINVDSKESIEQLNIDALCSVYLTDSSFIISATREELENIIPIIKDVKFQQQIYEAQFLRDLKYYRVEEWGDVFSVKQIENVYNLYQVDKLPDEIKKKFELFVQYIEKLATQ